MDFTTFLVLYILLKERQIIWNTITFLITSSVAEILWTPVELLFMGILLLDIWATRFISPHLDVNKLDSTKRLKHLATQTKNQLTLAILINNGFKEDPKESKNSQEPVTNQ
jgi:hypothetical protein